MQVEKEKRKRKPKRRYVKFIILSGIVIVTLIAVVVAGFLASIEGFGSTFALLERRYSGTEARVAIRRDLRVSLPVGTIGAEYYFTAWQDYVIQMRFEIPADTLVDIINGSSRLCFDLPLEEDFNPLEIYSDLSMAGDWWHPESAEVFAGAECSRNQVYYGILVDQTDPDRWIVYIHTFG